MTASIGATDRKERRAWVSQAEHQALIARLTDDGRTDKITGFHDKRYLVEVLEPQMEIKGQYKFPISIVLAEIAHFRQIRFTFGDAVADRILKDTAHTIKSTVRAQDLLVRYGDEIFGLLLLHCNRMGARQVSNRIKNAIARHRFDSGRSDLVITVNFGAAEQLESFDLKGQELLSSVEKALARANVTGNGAIVD